MNSGDECPCEGKSDTWHRVNGLVTCEDSLTRKRMRNRLSKEKSRHVKRPPTTESETLLIKKLEDLMGSLTPAEKYLVRMLTHPDVIDTTGEYVRDMWKAENSG